MPTLRSAGQGAANERGSKRGVVPRVLAFSILTSIGALLLACGATPSEVGGEEAETELDSTRLPSKELGMGSSGEDVAALHAYLRRYGYLPSDSLRQEHPELSPLSDLAPGRDDQFDAATAKAVRLFQRNYGLPLTAVVDAPTLEALHAPRCGVPDAMERTGADDKFQFQGCRHHDHHVTWRLLNRQRDVSTAMPALDDVDFVATKDAIKRAFATWQGETEFTESLGGTGGAVELEFKWVASLPANDVAVLTGGCANKVISIDASNRWAIEPGNPPSGFLDFESVMLHEIGHALGVAHSASTAAVMTPSSGSGTMKRDLRSDDIAAISAKYDEWEQLPGRLLDVGAGANGQVWGIGTGLVGGGSSGHTIHAWTGSSWSLVSGSADRIAVDPNGVPWVVNARNEIHRRTTGDWTTGQFQPIPGCAHDIGIGANGDVWIVDCLAGSGGFRISKWNGSSWVRTGDQRAGLRIAVAEDGVPWIVNDVNRVYRRSTASTTGSWELLTDASVDTNRGAADTVKATDIAIGASLPLSPTRIPQVWVTSNNITGGYSIDLWNEQIKADRIDGALNWVQVWRSDTSTGLGISASPSGPWYLDGSANIFRQTK